MESKHKIMKLPLYPGYLGIIQTNDINYLKKFDNLHEVYEDTDHLFGHTSLAPYKGRKCIYIIINPSNKWSEMSPGVIAHEALHAVNMTFRTIGVLPDFDNDEPSAYLLMWIVNEVHDFIYGTNYNQVFKKKVGNIPKPKEE